MDRRNFLRGSAGIVAACATAPVLGGCGGDDDPVGSGATSPAAGASAAPSSGPPTAASTSTGGGQTTGVELPAYTPVSVAKLEYPPTESGVAGMAQVYPTTTVSAAEDGVGGGITIEKMSGGISIVPPPVAKNKFWQELNKRLGADLKVIVPGQASEYLTKLQTMLAGGDMPDFVQIVPMPRLPDVLSTEFQDLSEYLSGDAVSQYPNLANIPTAAWQNTVYNNAIYGLPTPVETAYNSVEIREDIRVKIGAPDTIADGEGFLELCRAMTDAKASRWATTNPIYMVTVFQQMLGAPNQWAIDDGKFISAYEAPETKEAISEVVKMWKDGLIFPDAFANTTSSYKLVGAGKVAFLLGRFAQWPSALSDFRSTIPTMKLTGLVLPKYEGGGPCSMYLGSGVRSISAMKKTKDPDRIRKLLAVADWLASPFGTTQDHFKRFGVEGVDYVMKDGVPQVTPTGVGERSLDLGSLVSPPFVAFYPGLNADDVKEMYEWQMATVPNGVPLPTRGLTSDTDLNKGSALKKPLTDVQSDIIQGRKDISAWDDAVKTWKKGGGDQIAQEYSQSYAQSH